MNEIKITRKEYDIKLKNNCDKFNVNFESMNIDQKECINATKY